MSKVDLNLTVQMKADSVFIGDICYALADDIYSTVWIKQLYGKDGEIRTEGTSGPICAVVGSTAYGDGSFTGSDGIEYGVDAGVIGVTNLAYCRDDEDVESLSQLGKIVDIPGGECFVTLIDEEGEFYIIIEDMQHNKLYSVNISTGELETPTCMECGAEISDFENYQYGGVCEDCYSYQDYEEEEDLDECCTANCTSAEFQRMAPGRNAKMIGMKKRSLGKKDKYNTLGEKTLKEKRTDSVFLKKAAKIAKVEIAYIEYFKNKEDWMVVLDSEDSYDADSFRDAVDDLLDVNSGEHSYDDLIGLGDVHLGTAEYYEVSDDDYSDLDPAWRDKVVVYCEPSKRYKARRALGEKRKARPDSENGLSEKDVKAIVLKSFQEVFEGNENVVLPKKLTSADTSLSIQINGNKPFKVAIKVIVNEEIGTYALDGLTNKDKELLPDSYFQGATLEEAEKDARAFAKDVSKLVKESLKESKRKMSEAFSDVDLDMDDDEWFEKIKAQREAEKQARQARRDAEKKARKDAEEKEARLARGEFTEEEKSANIKENCRMLDKYISTMHDDLFSAFQKAADPVGILDDNLTHFDPQPGTSYSKNDYEFFTFPMSVSVDSDRDDEETVEYIGDSSLDYYDGALTYYRTFSLEELKSVYTSTRSEADRFHSGKRNVEAFEKYFVDGTATFKNVNEVHDILDSDAELFASVKWIMYEMLGYLVAASCKAKYSDIKKAAATFLDTGYATEAGFKRIGSMSPFIQYASAFYADDAIEALEESRKLTGKALKENSLTSDKVLVTIHIPDDYYDKYGNPVNAEKYNERFEEIDKILFAAGAKAVWEVTSDPEAGWEGDDIDDTGFRRMTVAQLKAVIENSGIEEDEIRVYTDDIDVSKDNWSDYMNKHPEVNPYENSVDVYEDHRIYDIYSLVFDADDENSTERTLLQRMLQDAYTEKDAKDLAEMTGLRINDLIGFDDYVKLRDDWLVYKGKAPKDSQ